MDFFVYLLITKNKNRYISYVGFTKNINKRVKLHNTGKGAKFTRGRKWTLIYKKRYKSKSIAMKEEFKLKNDRKMRNLLKTEYINNK
jgi:putative endonuclease